MGGDYVMGLVVGGNLKNYACRGNGKASANLGREQNETPGLTALRKVGGVRSRKEKAVGMGHARGAWGNWPETGGRKGRKPRSREEYRGDDKIPEITCKWDCDRGALVEWHRRKKGGAASRTEERDNL